jgi:hypothetical protein
VIKIHIKGRALSRPKPLKQDVSPLDRLTHRDPSQDKQADAGGHPQQAVAQSTQQQTRQHRVPPPHHVTPAALPITTAIITSREVAYRKEEYFLT